MVGAIDGLAAIWFGQSHQRLPFAALEWREADSNRTSLLIVVVVIVFILVEGDDLNVVQRLRFQQMAQFLNPLVRPVDHYSPRNPFPRVFAALTYESVPLALFRTNLKFQHEPIINHHIWDAADSIRSLRHPDSVSIATLLTPQTFPKNTATQSAQS